MLFLSKNVPVSWKQALVLFHPDIDLLHASYAACVDSSVLENLGTVVTVSETHTFYDAFYISYRHPVFSTFDHCIDQGQVRNDCWMIEVQIIL